MWAAERYGFEPRERRADLGGIGVTLRERDGRLRVFTHAGPLFGLPPRRGRPPAMWFRPGQWVRRRLDYRFSSTGGAADWSYWLDTLDIAYGPGDRAVFLGRPTVPIDECGPVR